MAVLDGRACGVPPCAACHAAVAVLDGRVHHEGSVTGRIVSTRAGGRLGRPCVRREMCRGTHLEQTRGWPSWTAVCATRDVSRDVS